MDWKQVVALIFGFLILGLTISSASATAEFVNTSTNNTLRIPLKFALERKPRDGIQPQFLPTIGVGISIVLGSTELLALTVGLATILAMGLYKVIEKYGGPLSRYVLRATGMGQTSEFGDGFLRTAGNHMRNPKVRYYLKKIWIIPIPKVERVAIYDGSRRILEVKTSELDQVSDLFSPKEFGQLVARAWLNGWSTDDAKTLAKEFNRKYKGFKAHFRGGYACGDYFPEGDVTIDREGARHIIDRHISREIWKRKSKFQHLTADMILQMIKTTIETGKPYCDGKNSINYIAIEKYYPGVGAKNKLRVVIERLPSGLYRIVTAFPVDWD